MSRFTVIVESEAPDLFCRMVWQTRKAIDADTYAEANLIAAQEKKAWTDPNIQVRIVENKEDYDD